MKTLQICGIKVAFAALALSIVGAGVFAAEVSEVRVINTNNPNIKTIRDIGPTDRIALPGVKTSNQAINAAPFATRR